MLPIVRHQPLGHGVDLGDGGQLVKIKKIREKLLLAQPVSKVAVRLISIEPDKICLFIYVLIGKFLDDLKQNNTPLNLQIFFRILYCSL